MENRLIAYIRNQLKLRGYKGDGKATAERLAHLVATSAYEKGSLRLCASGSLKLRMVLWVKCRMPMKLLV